MYRLTEAGNKFIAVKTDINDPYARDDIISLMAEDNQIVLVIDPELFAEDNEVEVEVVGE